MQQYISAGAVDVAALAALLRQAEAERAAWAGYAARLLAELAAARRAAYTDPLTGLANRAGLEAELARRDRPGGVFSVLLADLDGFKPVNDRLGHAAGDAVLVEVAGRLARVTPDGGFVARLGGDEFVLLAPPRAARGLAEVVCRAVARPIPVAGVEVTVGVSVGLAHPAAGVDEPELLRRADVALYRAKAAGRGRVTEMGEADDVGVAPAGRPAARLRDMYRLRQQVAERSA